MVLSDTHNQWQEQARHEQVRLLAALGEVTKGGLIENVQHIGSTSVPGLEAMAPIDLALTTTPFPLEPATESTLQALGYQAIRPQPSDFEHCFLHTTGNFQLYVTEPGSEEWVNHLLVRDYLCNNEDARRFYSAHKAVAPSAGGGPREMGDAKHAPFASLLADAKHWWLDYHGWKPVEFVVQELQGYNNPWYISSGWALDLFLGQVTRVHHDVDVVVARTDQLALRDQLSGRGWSFVTPLEGKLEPWPSHMQIELPRHQIHAHRDGYFIDFLLTDMVHGIWRYRRNPTIIRRVEQAGLRSSQGVPYLAPEIVLLFKSKNTGTRERNKDQSDFERVLPLLEPEARAWLRWALIATDQAHSWIKLLG